MGLLAAATMVGAPIARAGSLFLTGHDPDFHAQQSTAENPVGAQHIIQAAITFVMDPLANPLVVGGAGKFVFVGSKGAVPGGHLQGVDGIVASGYALDVDFDHHDASTLGAALDGLGTTYGGIVVSSDFGGVLTQAELDILNARSQNITDFLNAGGGLVAFAESNGGAGLTPSGGQYGFLPFVASSTTFNNSEVGNTVTPYGRDLGLVDADVNGNFSHNVFVADFGLTIVDTDPSGNILSLAGRGIVGPGGLTTTTTTTQTSTTTTTTTVASSTTTTLPAQLLSGKKLLLKWRPDQAKKGLLNLLSKDPLLTLGNGPGSAHDPTEHGGSLRVYAAGGDAFDDTYDLAAGSWRYLSKKKPANGYKFGKGHPITSILVKPGKQLTIVGKGTALGHTLASDPRPVLVELRLGVERYCMGFGGTVKFTAGKKYLAKNSAVGEAACPP